MGRAWLGHVDVGDGKPVAIIGAINLTRGTFYRGSFRKPNDAVRRAMEMTREGADIIDVGAMSTGPTSKPISPKKESRLLISTLSELRKEIDVPISVDTQRAEIAEAAIEAGASIINDISGLKADAHMAEVIAEAGCSVVIMAAKKAPGDVYEVGEIKRALKASLKICRQNHIPKNRVVIDPAVGYWPARLARLGPRAKSRVKGHEYSLATHLDLLILSGLKKLKIGPPICVGISRKSFVGDVLNLPKPEDRLFGSLSAAAIAVFNGAHALRTHDPKETLQVARIAEALRDAGG